MAFNAARNRSRLTARSFTEEKVTPSKTARASQASFCSAEALSVRTSTEPSTTVLSGSAGALPGQVKPSTVTRTPARRNASMIAALAIS